MISTGLFTQIEVSACGRLIAALHENRVVLIDSRTKAPFMKVEGEYLSIIFSSQFLIGTKDEEYTSWEVTTDLVNS